MFFASSHSPNRALRGVSAALPPGAGSTASGSRGWLLVALACTTLLTPLLALLPAPWRVLLVVAPVVEEIVFRAGLHEAMLNHRWLASANPWAANALTAAAFASAHAVWHGGPLVWLTVVPALGIGLVYQRGRRVIPCIALHAFFNAVWLAAVGLPA